MELVETLWYRDDPSDDTKLIAEPVQYIVGGSRIQIKKSPFAFKDEIKSMGGARWHGFDPEPKKEWSIANTRRNHFQLGVLENKDPSPYAWFDRLELPDPMDYLPDTLAFYEACYTATKEQIPMDFKRPLKRHQELFVRMCHFLHFHIIAGEMGTGKTLAYQETIERGYADHGIDKWLYIGPLKVLDNIKYEFGQWDFPFDKIHVDFWNPEKLRNFDPHNCGYGGVVLDESTAFKNFGTDQSKGAFALAEHIRDVYGNDGYVIAGSGTPAPKTPVDWWSICEIVYPGFLKEGSEKAFKRRLAFMEQQEINPDHVISKAVGFRDDEMKCDKCGVHKDEHFTDDHKWRPSVNEVMLLNSRLLGLVTTVFKKDVLKDLPEKIFKVETAKPSPSVMRAAKVIMNSADSVITAMTQLRQLSDGFQYREVMDGEMKCDACSDGTMLVWQDKNDPNLIYENLDFVLEGTEYEETTVPCLKCRGKQVVPKKKRQTKEIPTPKQGMLEYWLKQCEDTGRLVSFAGFKGSLSRICTICHKQGWSTIRCDGTGWTVSTPSEVLWKQKEGADSLDFWRNTKDNELVAFVSHPKSGGKGLTLTESNVAVFWSNDFNPESRWQAIDRVHRMGQTRGVYIVDFDHLPTDTKVREVLEQNRKLEKMTLGDFAL